MIKIIAFGLFLFSSVAHSATQAEVDSAKATASQLANGTLPNTSSSNINPPIDNASANANISRLNSNPVETQYFGGGSADNAVAGDVKRLGCATGAKNQNAWAQQECDATNLFSNAPQSRPMFKIQRSDPIVQREQTSRVNAVNLAIGPGGVVAGNNPNGYGGLANTYSGCTTASNGATVTTFETCHDVLVPVTQPAQTINYTCQQSNAIQKTCNASLNATATLTPYCTIAGTGYVTSTNPNGLEIIVNGSIPLIGRGVYHYKVDYACQSAAQGKAVITPNWALRTYFYNAYSQNSDMISATLIFSVGVPSPQPLRWASIVNYKGVPMMYSTAWYDGVNINVSNNSLSPSALWPPADLAITGAYASVPESCPVGYTYNAAQGSCPATFTPTGASLDNKYACYNITTKSCTDITTYSMGNVKPSYCSAPNDPGIYAATMTTPSQCPTGYTAVPNGNGARACTKDVGCNTYYSAMTPATYSCLNGGVLKGVTWCVTKAPNEYGVATPYSGTAGLRVDLTESVDDGCATYQSQVVP